MATANTFNSLVPIFKQKYDRPARGVSLRVPSVRVNKPVDMSNNLNTNRFKKLKAIITI